VPVTAVLVHVEFAAVAFRACCGSLMTESLCVCVDDLMYSLIYSSGCFSSESTNLKLDFGGL